jgi:5-methylcytosine-specific restriction endonuclease McrA
MDILKRKGDYTRPYRVHGRRASTLRHAAASAIAPHEAQLSDSELLAAMDALEQDPADLQCVYCGETATQLDHFHALVRDGKWTGFGNTLGNRVPACARCNVAKGNKDPFDWMLKTHPERVAIFVERIERLHSVTREPNPLPPIEEVCPTSAKHYKAMQETVLAIMRMMDAEAATIRAAYAEYVDGQRREP